MCFFLHSRYENSVLFCINVLYRNKPKANMYEKAMVASDHKCLHGYISNLVIGNQQ